MSYSAEKNQIVFLRAKNLAAALQNVKEEQGRLLSIFETEISPASKDDANFTDTDIATVGEFKALLSVAGSVATIVEQNDQQLVPFLIDKPVLER